MKAEVLKRVAIFDNDDEWTLAARVVLEQAGYLPEAFKDDFDGFCTRLKESAFLIAMVNVDSLASIETQLQQVHEHSRGCGVIITGRESSPHTERFLRPPLSLADQFLNKTDYLVADLPDLCDDWVHKHLAIPRELEIVLPDGFDDLVERYAHELRFTGEVHGLKMSSKLITEEFLVILSRMFRGDDRGIQHVARRILVEPLQEGFGAAFVFRITPELAISVKAPKSAVLKFGPREDIDVEARNYDRFVEWFLTVDQTVRRIGHEEFSSFGGILYSFPRDVTTGYVSFADYVREKDVGRSTVILERMFCPEYKHWLAVDGNKYLPPRDQTLQWYYLNKVLRATPYDMQADYFTRQYLAAANNRAKKHRAALAKQGLDELIRVGGDDKLTFPFVPHSVPNPLRYLQKPLVKTIQMAIAHGDLHANNILISDDDRFFFIDFYYTTFGHVHRDFIQLELSLRYDLTMSRQLPRTRRYLHSDGEYDTNDERVLAQLLAEDTEGLKKLIRLEKAIIGKTIYGKELQDPLIGDTDELQNLFSLIVAIRRLAFDNFPEDPASYYQGLVFSALKTLKYWYPLHVRTFYLMLAGEYVKALERNAMELG